MRLAIAFTNFGPYHLARLRALGARLRADGDELIAHEMASVERKYPWSVDRGDEPFTWRTLFPDQAIEDVAPSLCTAAMLRMLDEDRPDVVAVVGYVRPESMAALSWAEKHGRPAILLSESQRIDSPRVWWKEVVKRRRVRRFSSALVGGSRHRAYLESLGMPKSRTALGYNAIDHNGYARRARELRETSGHQAIELPRPYFLAVSRFAPEKNLIRLLHAFALYRADANPANVWDLVLCGGGEMEDQVDSLATHLGVKTAVHRPGFLGESELAPYYAFASGFILPSQVEPWGLVANEAAASGLPLLISDCCGCVETLIPDNQEPTGRDFDPNDIEEIAGSMAWLAGLDADERKQMGRQAEIVASRWGADRFADGMIEAVELAESGPVRTSRQDFAEAAR